MNLFPDIYLHAFRKRKQLHSGAQLTIALILPPARQQSYHYNIIIISLQYHYNIVTTSS